MSSLLCITLFLTFFSILSFSCLAVSIMVFCCYLISMGVFTTFSLAIYSCFLVSLRPSKSGIHQEGAISLLRCGLSMVVHVLNMLLFARWSWNVQRPFYTIGNNGSSLMSLSLFCLRTVMNLGLEKQVLFLYYLSRVYGPTISLVFHVFIVSKCLPVCCFFWSLGHYSCFSSVVFSFMDFIGLNWNLVIVFEKLLWDFERNKFLFCFSNVFIKLILFDWKKSVFEGVAKLE